MALVVMGGLCWLAAAAVPIAIVNETGPDEIWSAACEPVGIDWCQTQKYWDAKGIEGYRLGPGRCPVMGECDDPVVRDEHLVQPDTLFKTVRMHIHVFREDDGSNSAATEYEVLALFDEINADYAPWRIRFDCTWGFVDDSRYRYGQDIGQMKRTYAISPETTCNVYIIALGYAYGTFPWDPDALTAQGGIAYEETFIDDYSHALSHEMGHCLGLWHTHHGVSEVEQCGPCYEEPEPPFDTTGDFCAGVRAARRHGSVLRASLGSHAARELHELRRPLATLLGTVHGQPGRADALLDRGRPADLAHMPGRGGLQRESGPRRL